MESNKRRSSLIIGNIIDNKNFIKQFEDQINEFKISGDFKNAHKQI